MQKTTTIRRITSFFLLVVFAISMAPKAYFHDVFANHSDSITTCTDEAATAHFHQGGIHCHFDQLVVSSEFTYTFPQLTATSPSYSVNRQDVIECSNLPQQYAAKESRGPPLTV